MNTDVIRFIISVAAGYLLGSIPSAVWAGKIFHGIDIREHGSGNAGATNVIRVLGWKTGIPVMLADIAKGWLAALLPHILNAAGKGSSMEINMMIVAGLAAIAGHVYPVFAGFRGGKGVGTTVGVLIALNPLLTLSCIGVFLAVLLITGYVSLSSMSFGVSFPLLLFTLFDTPSVIFRVFSVFIAVALIYTHRSNIKRLIRGEEPKFIKRKKKQ
ncbi:MAG TPA: glycerol-3-phosphate 1-O-acyltransferase PlsY [Bacteroidales bacterium]|nr:glycerol-3-phosphate 1-O-acyltransferase PlsY [Bacteroidales bacterium]